MGIFDQDVSDRVSLAVPQLYRRGIERKEWSQWKFWLVFSGTLSIVANNVSGLTCLMVYTSLP